MTLLSSQLCLRYTIELQLHTIGNCWPIFYFVPLFSVNSGHCPCNVHWSLKRIFLFSSCQWCGQCFSKTHQKYNKTSKLHKCVMHHAVRFAIVLCIAQLKVKIGEKLVRGHTQRMLKIGTFYPLPL